VLDTAILGAWGPHAPVASSCVPQRRPAILERVIAAGAEHPRHGAATSTSSTGRRLALASSSKGCRASWLLQRKFERPC
jgi:hypothetical protein